jgi:hypothetical protein
MKIKLILLLLSTSAFLITTYCVDRELFYTGFSVLPMPNPLPFNLEPQFENISDGNSGFYLMDEFGFTSLGKGVRHVGSTLLIKKVLGYGFNDTILIGKVIGQDSSVHLVSFTKSTNSNHPYKFADTLDINNTNLMNKIKWITIKPEQEYSKYRSYRSIGLYIVTILLVCSIFEWVKYLNRNNINR